MKGKRGRDKLKLTKAVRSGWEKRKLTGRKGTLKGVRPSQVRCCPSKRTGGRWERKGGGGGGG